MSEVHQNELGFFVDSLSPHQRVYLQRLVGEFLTSFPEAGSDPHPEWLDLHRQSAQDLFSLLDLLRAFENDDSDSDIRPYALSMPEPGHGQLKLSRRILHWRGLWDPKSHKWITEVNLGRLSIDCAALEELTSSVIAWLVTLASHLPDKRLHLLHVAPVIRRALLALHLHQILVIDAGQ